MLVNFNWCEKALQCIEEGILIVDDQGKIAWLNHNIERMFGYSSDELFDQTLELLVATNSKSKHEKLSANFFLNPTKRSMGRSKEFKGQRKDGSSIWLKIGLNFFEENGRNYVIAAISDKTDDWLNQKKIKSHEEKAKLFFDLSKALFLELDKDGQVQAINNEGCKVLEYEEKDIINKNWFDYFIEPKKRPELKEVFENLVNGNISENQYVNSSIITKSGKPKIIQWQNSVLIDEDGKIKGTISSGMDITPIYELKKEQTEAILISEEKERKRVALELHDGLVQTLSSISMHLKSFEDEIHLLTKNGQVAYEDALKLLMDCIADTRAISHDLMPSSILRDGLVKALDDLGARTTKYHGIQVVIDPDHVDHSLNEMQRLNIYRISQELIQNTIKHANAELIKVKIRMIGDMISVSFKDNGTGYKESLESVTSRGIGLKNIKTRVDSLNGELTILSSVKKGTEVNIQIPII